MSHGSPLTPAQPIISCSRHCSSQLRKQIHGLVAHSSNSFEFGDSGDGYSASPAIEATVTTRRNRPSSSREHTHLLGLNVDEDWSMMGAQLHTSQPSPGRGRGRRRSQHHRSRATTLGRYPDPALLVAPVPRAAQGVIRRRRRQPARQPRWACTTCDRLVELLREQIRAEHTTSRPHHRPTIATIVS